MKPVTLTVDGLVLSTPVERDIDLIAELCDDVAMRDTTTLPWPYARADAEFFVQRLVAPGWATDTEFTFGIRDAPGGPLKGVVGWRAENSELGYWMGAAHRGHGHMSAAVTAVCEWVFATQDVPVITWRAIIGNVASARTARAAGFRFIDERPLPLPDRYGPNPIGWYAERDRADPSPGKAGWPL